MTGSMHASCPPCRGGRYHARTLDPARERLAELVCHRRRLVDERVALGNRIDMLRCSLLQAQNRKRLALIAQQIEQTGTLILEAIGQIPSLLAKVETLKGVKDVTAIALLALPPELGRITRRAVAALVGLAPFDHDSGKLKGTRSIAGGRAAVRTALYRAARAAARSKSPLGEFYKRLIAAGKPQRSPPSPSCAKCSSPSTPCSVITRRGSMPTHANDTVAPRPRSDGSPPSPPCRAERAILPLPSVRFTSDDLEYERAV